MNYWKNYPNLFKEKRSALQVVMNNENIIIKPGGKEIAFLTWSRERTSWKKEWNKQLSNKNIYEKCNEFPAVQLNKEIRSILSSMLSKKEIDKKIIIIK